MSLLSSRGLYSLRTSRQRLGHDTWSHSRSYRSFLTPRPLLPLALPVQTIDVEKRSRRPNEIGYWSTNNSQQRHSHHGSVPFYGLPRPVKEPSTSSSGSGLLNLAQRLTAVAQDAIVLSTKLATPTSRTSNWSATNTAINDATTAKTAFSNQQQQQQDHSRLGRKDQHQNAATTNASYERLQLTWHFAKLAANDPTRADAVAAVGELTGRVTLNTRLLSSMQRDATGRRILHERPLVSKATIPYELLMAQARDIRNRPKTLDTSNAQDLTFGQAYGLFLLDHGFDPDERDGVHHLSSHLHVSEQELEHEALLAYIMIRYRQCHDFWHVLTGLPPTVVGELGLKWLELFDTGLPSAALACTVGSLWATTDTSRTTTSSSTQHENPSNGLFPRLDAQQLHNLHVIWNVYLPWARRIHQHKTAKANPGSSSSSSLMNVYYEEEWDTPLVDLRHRLGIEEAPRTG